MTNCFISMSPRSYFHAIPTTKWRPSRLFSPAQLLNDQLKQHGHGSCHERCKWGRRPSKPPPPHEYSKPAHPLKSQGDASLVMTSVTDIRNVTKIKSSSSIEIFLVPLWPHSQQRQLKFHKIYHVTNIRNLKCFFSKNLSELFFETCLFLPCT